MPESGSPPIHAADKAATGNEAGRQAAYRALFKQKLAQNELESIRESTNKAWVLGSDKFKQRVEELSGRRASPKPKGRPKKDEE